MDRAVRVLVANQPRLMRELIRDALADQPGIEIVGEVQNDADIPARVKETLPDLVFVGLDGEGARPKLCEEILRERPDVRILAVAFRENRTVCYWASLDIHASEIETSEQGILDAVRNIAAGKLFERCLEVGSEG
jgi:DNA-binding NarL/FixJ family response regulator